MLKYLPEVNIVNILTVLTTVVLLWILKELVYIISIRYRGLKSLYQVPGYTFFLDWEAFTWPAQRYTVDLHLKRRERLGPIFAIKSKLFKSNVIVISDPSMIESLYKIDGKTPSRTGSRTSGFKVFQRFQNSPKGILLSEGEDWARKRKPISRSILNASIINQFVPELNDFAVCLADRISDSLNENRITSSLQFLIRCASVEGAGSFVYQKNLGYLSKDLPEKSRNLLESGFSLFHSINLLDGYSFLATLIKSKRLFENMIPFRNMFFLEIDESIKIRQASNGNFQSDRFDFMSNILNEKSLTQGEVRVLSFGLFVAGIDTTATTILMTLHQLGLNIDKQTKLRNEINSVVGDRDSITRQDIDHLQYLKLCIRESQRLYPAVIGVPRVTKQDLVLNGYHIPRDTLVYINNYLIGRQGQLFSNPEEYIPERWEQPELQNPYYFLPFGHGPRMCVGKMYAELEIFIFITQIIRRFEIESMNNFEVCGRIFLESDRELIFKCVPVD